MVLQYQNGIPKCFKSSCCKFYFIKERVDPEIEALMETGVDEMSWDDTVSYYTKCNTYLISTVVK